MRIIAPIRAKANNAELTCKIWVKSVLFSINQGDKRHFCGPPRLNVYLTSSGIWLCDVTSRDLGVHDHSGIVWDEFVGYLITMVAAPQGWLWVVVGFFLFRFFDILKPWPISWIDKHVKGGWGIMLDDILAGVFSLLALQATRFFLF